MERAEDFFTLFFLLEVEGRQGEEKHEPAGISQLLVRPKKYRDDSTGGIRAGRNGEEWFLPGGRTASPTPLERWSVGAENLSERPFRRGGFAPERREVVHPDHFITHTSELREGGQSATGCATDNDGRIPFPFENSVIADRGWTGLRDTGTPARSAPHSFAGPFGGRATNPFDGPLRITR
ncbi:hypothetical protein ACIQJX_11610 [Streptomyces griseoviridis]